MVVGETVIGLESQRQFVGDICQEEQVGDEYSLVTGQNTSVSRPHVTCKLHPALRPKSVISMLVFVRRDFCPAKWHSRSNAMFRRLCNRRPSSPCRSGSPRSTDLLAHHARLELIELLQSLARPR